MYEHSYPQFQPVEPTAPVETIETPAAEVGREADPYDVINFLLKKVEEQQARLQEQDGYIELQTQEIEQLKGRTEAMQQEIEQQLADYEVLMQNTLAVERELETYKQKSNEKPTIKLPFYAEEKLAKLGYGTEETELRQAV